MGAIAARTAHGTAHVRIDPEAREQLPLLCDRSAIALESLRTQWRTVSNLGTHERMALSQLRVYGSMPMSELAARISLSRAAITSLVDRLEANGWVSRQPDEHDRRRTVLTLQPRTLEEFTSVSTAFNDELATVANDLSNDEYATIASFLDRIGEIANRQAHELRSTASERSLA